MFADDVLLFSSSPDFDLPLIKQSMDRFREIAGLKINFTKSEILSLAQRKPRPWFQTSPFAIAKDKIKYLGLYIGKHPSSIYNLNYPPVIEKVIKELEHWQTLPLSLTGRAHLFKMISFPKLLYPLQNLPCLLKRKDITKLNKTLTQFLWQSKKPRIALKKLSLPRAEGGLNIPNLKCYNLACLLRHAMDWLTHKSNYSNGELEDGMVSPWTLANILHTPLKCLPPHVRTNMLFRDTIIAWRDIRKQQNKPPTLSRMTGIQGSPHFPQGIQHQGYVDWSKQGLHSFEQFFYKGSWRPKTFKDLQKEFKLPDNHLIYFQQATSFWKSVRRPPVEIFAHTFLDSLRTWQTYKTAVSYPKIRILFSEPRIENQDPPWKKDFTNIRDKDQLLDGYLKITRTTVSESWKETQLKILHRAYSMFFRQMEGGGDKRQPKTDTIRPCCPKCHITKPTLKHALWSCPSVEQFWTQVHCFAMNTLYGRDNKNTDKDPLLCLFGIEPTPGPYAKTGQRNTARWEHTCYLVAKRCLLKQWIHAQAPTLEMVKAELKKLFLIERLDAEMTIGEATWIIHQALVRIFVNFIHPPGKGGLSGSPIV